jgi:hypothetical protein
MPMQFRKYFGTKCAVIIDCFEVFIDIPSNLKARAETWSSYKHHNTVKFLIGITPQGTISFISNAWGGRASDKYITEHSGFLNNIFPGDLVLADRGFDIHDSVGSLMAQVKIPSFTRGNSQLTPVDFETTRKIAHIRIHVERVIGMVRQKFTILDGQIPIDLLICKDDDIEQITFDMSMWETICAKAKHIFITAILPELIGKFYSRLPFSNAKPLVVQETDTTRPAKLHRVRILKNSGASVLRLNPGK